MSIQGKRIKELREKYGLTQEELAKACGYKTRAAIHLVESGKNEMTLTRLILCAQVLNTTTSFLSGETDNPVRPKSQDVSDKAYMEVRNKITDFMVGEKTKTIIELFRDLSEEDQDTLLIVADYLSNASDNQKTWLKFACDLGIKDEALAHHNQLFIKDVITAKNQK